MASIDPINFGSNLRPSVVSNIKKINELVTAVNEVDPSSISTLKTRVTTAEKNITQLQTDVNTLKTSVNEISTSLSSALTDISKIKTTLYTPLESTE